MKRKDVENLIAVTSARDLTATNDSIEALREIVAAQRKDITNLTTIVKRIDNQSLQNAVSNLERLMRDVTPVVWKKQIHEAQRTIEQLVAQVGTLVGVQEKSREEMVLLTERLSAVAKRVTRLETFIDPIHEAAKKWDRQVKAWDAHFEAQRPTLQHIHDRMAALGTVDQAQVKSCEEDIEACAEDIEDLRQRMQAMAQIGDKTAKELKDHKAFVEKWMKTTGTTRTTKAAPAKKGKPDGTTLRTPRRRAKG